MAKYQWKKRHQNDSLRINKISLFRTGGEKLQEVAELRSLKAHASTRKVEGSFELHDNKMPWMTSENFMIGVFLEYRKSGKKLFHTHHHVKVSEVDGILFNFVGRKGITKHG